tara:strand:- start:4084 stop:4494 length:411 start_codon:yes stop_codon:yes gene_type:complete
MKKYEQEAIDTALYWNKEGFNKRNQEVSVEHMHFPHIRLWENRFSIFKNKEEFLKGFDQQSKNLSSERWNHTVTKSIQVIQSDPEKVHLILHQSRRDKNGKEYHNFHTLWIMTKINEKWGIQFRSSFLEGASMTSL